MHLAMLGVPFTGGTQKLQDTSMQDFGQAQQMLLSRGPAAAAQATTLFRRAAKQHNPLAEYDLGYCYEHAMGVPRDLSQAYDWYQRAAGDATDSALRSIAEVGASNLEPRVAHTQAPAAGASRSSD
jgi:TPR repeat protein